jgi:queuine/archaeosine tRNA-ribosyltransferase
MQGLRNAIASQTLNSFVKAFYQQRNSTQVV